ncbi:MAG: SRPBCC domain-containing protein [Bacteroidia bacterium]|nr:SRPBCC domain-containing protein [Bacteroidia bacterium]
MKRTDRIQISVERAENDLRKYGRFLYRMEARDGSFGFDFSGEYRKIENLKLIEYVLDDSRKVSITFGEKNNETIITESFETEEINPADLQKDGWQSILNNFKKYAESSENHEILHFETLINSPVDRVYETMLREDTYKSWTSVFNSDSRYEGSWKKGSKIVFIGTDSNGNTGGMVSRIKENLQNKFVSIEHLGIVKNGNEIMSGSDVDEWKGALENYSFKAKGDNTLLSVDIDSNKEFKSYFSDTWPKALSKLKSICE